MKDLTNITNRSTKKVSTEISRHLKQNANKNLSSNLSTGKKHCLYQPHTRDNNTDELAKGIIVNADNKNK